MSHNFRIYIVCILLSALRPLCAQPFIDILNYNHNRYGINNNIRHITQDRKGLIWFSTYDGLYKFDGNTFTCYKATIDNNSPLASNHIESVCEDSHSNLWCLVKNKPYLFQRPDNQFIKLNAGKDSTDFQWDIDRIYNLSEKTLFTTAKGGVLQVDDNDCHHTAHLLIKETATQRPIQRIVNDKQNSFWIFYRDKTVIVQEGGTATFERSFKDMIETPDRYWLISDRGEIAYTDVRYSSLQYLPNPYRISKIHSYYKYKEKIIYFATDRGILCLNSQSHEQQLYQLPAGNRVEPRELYMDKQEYLWVSSNSPAVFRMNPTSHELESIAVLHDDNQQISDMLFMEDKNHRNMWLCDNGYTDFWFYSETQKAFVHGMKNPLHSVIRSSFTDRDGNLWIGNHEGIRLVTFHEGNFQNKDIEEEVLCIFKEKNGNIWYSTREGYLRIHDASLNLLGYMDKNGHITTEKKKFNRIVCQIIEDRQGNVWMAARGSGLLLLQRQQENIYRIQTFKYDESDPYSINERNVYTVFEDSYGHIWAGGLTGGGINLVSQTPEGKYIFINSRNLWSGWKDKEPTFIRCFLQVYPSTLLVACDTGLFTFDCRLNDVGNIHFYCNRRIPNLSNSLSNNTVLCLLQSSTGNIYVGTSGGGLCRIVSDNLLSDSIRFKAITQAKDGLPSDIIYSLIEDNDRRIWGFCDNNLFCLSTDESAIESYINYQVPDFHRFTIGNSVQMNNNHLLKGYCHGLFSFNPLQTFKKQNVPPLYISHITPMGKDKASKGEPTEYMELTPEERDISIDYSVLDYQRNAPINYAYRLIGLDDTWKYHTNEHTINYMNLPSGEYTFEIRSTNGDGVWVENTQRIKLHVIPTFWETRWSWACYLTIFVLALGFIFYIYQRFYLLRHKLKLERAMTETKLNFFTDISHEIRTPLTLIDGPVDEVLRDKELSKESREYLLVVQKNVRHILNLIHHILDFRKIEQQSNFLTLEPIDAHQELSDIMEHFSSVAKEKDITFNFISNTGPCTLWADKEKFERIFFNLLSNAFKYTENGKSITVTLARDEKFITVSVADEGCGIEEKRIAGLFKRFENIAKDNLFKPSSGLGLAMVKSLADAHQATIQVESKPGKGSCFTLRFKDGFKHFENERNVEITRREQPSPKDTVGDSAESHPTTVLIVEDNDELRRFISRILGSQYRILEATNGKEGLEMTRTHWPDLIVSDVMMPEMDGFSMVWELKNDPDIYLIPVILLTAKSGIDDKIRGAELAVDDYIVKPFSATYLKIKINALLKQRELLRMQILSEAEQKGASFRLPTSLPEGQIKTEDEKFVQQLMEIIENNISDSRMFVDDIASSFHVSRSIFNRKVKAILGCTPIDLIINMRVKHAIHLFETTDSNVSEVAYQSGFSDARYFARMFKRITGQTPKSYREQCRQQ